VVPKHRSFFKKKRELDLSNPSAFVENLTCEVTEVRKVRGVFHETIELNDFPIDRQEISVALASHKSVHEVMLVEDKSKDNLINHDRFYEQGVWHMFPYVGKKKSIIFS
jgi:hypothetical protein